MRWRYAPAAALLAVMAVVLARSEETAQAVRDGLALCAQSVVPALFPFFVLSGLFISMGCAGVLAPALGRLPGVSPAGASAFLLGAVGGYPVGARTVGQLRAAGLCGREEGECLLTCCNNAGPAFIFGVAGLGCFGSLRAARRSTPSTSALPPSSGCFTGGAAAPQPVRSPRPYGCVPRRR